ncbi:uncharacterized protein METZ01_LOCUS40208 [marine metagenome]|uniref:Uncharacterized protein n=1 Tax=marine metagenome TaxID=408172 RepID=A0A381R825_9ZZZZ
MAKQSISIETKKPPANVAGGFFIGG